MTLYSMTFSTHLDKVLKSAFFFHFTKISKDECINVQSIFVWKAKILMTLGKNPH
jgi:hypothetical protein